MTDIGTAKSIGEIEVKGFHEELIRESFDGYQNFHFIVIETLDDPFFRYQAVCIEMNVKGRGMNLDNSIADLCHALVVSLHAVYKSCNDNHELFKSLITSHVVEGMESRVCWAYNQARFSQMALPEKMQFMSIQAEPIIAKIEPKKIETGEYIFQLDAGEHEGVSARVEYKLEEVA